MTRVHLIEASPFAAVFPGGVPVKSPVTRATNCNGSIEQCYFVDLDALRDDEKLGLWRVMAKGAGVDVETVAREIAAQKEIPLRANQTVEGGGISQRFLS